MAHGKLNQPQKRNYKDPDQIKASHSVAMTDAEFEELSRAAKISNQTKGEFIAKMVRHYLTLCDLRGAENGFK